MSKLVKVRVVKAFRHGVRIFNEGEIGIQVTVDYPLMVGGKPVYECYVKFPDYEPVGVMKDEVEFVKK